MATRTVLLRHDLPDGSWHFDWMIQRPSDPNGKLLTFRVQVRLDQPSTQRFTAVRLEDHRAEYLTFEGPISGGRGSVSRVAEGTCLSLTETPFQSLISVNFGLGGRTFSGIPQPDSVANSWTFATARAGQPP